MSNIFQKLELAAFRNQITPRTEESRKWFMKKAQTMRGINREALMKEEPLSSTGRRIIGSMQMFFYDPKYKDVLPYYDRFPLIFPFKKVRGGFLGINLHYLPLRLRAKLMDELYTLSRDNRYDEDTRLRISYNILNGAAKYKYFKPCVKHYLTPHVKSRFLEVYAAEWDIALFLPTERFVGAGKGKVHADSRKMI